MGGYLKITSLIILACAAITGTCQDLGVLVPKVSPGSELPYSGTFTPREDSVLFYLSVINMEGNRRTRDYIVEREYAVKAGESYSSKQLSEAVRTTKENLMNTTLFVSVEVEVDTITNIEVEINILVKERWYFFPVPYFSVVDRSLNVWIKDQKASIERANLGLKLIQNNTSGNNDPLNVWVVGGYTQQLSFRYQMPYLDKKLEKGMSVGFSYSRNREVNYATDSNRQLFVELPDFARTHLRGDVSFSYRKGSRLRMNVGASFNREEVDTAITRLNPNYFGNGDSKATYYDLFYDVQYYNVDYIPYPLRGWQLTGYAMQRFSKNIPMTQFGGSALATWNFLKKTNVNFQFAFQAKIGQDQPFFNSRLLGYNPLILQGLDSYVVDGTFGAMARTTLKYEFLSFKVKNIIKSKSHDVIPFRLFFKTYGNLGYAHQRDAIPSNFLNNRILRTAGVGIDILTIYDLVIKLEYSFNQFGESGFFIRGKSDF